MDVGAPTVLSVLTVNDIPTPKKPAKDFMCNIGLSVIIHWPYPGKEAISMACPFLMLHTELRETFCP
jgi:hypothetical protein